MDCRRPANRIGSLPNLWTLEGKEAPQKTHADFPPAGESGKKFPVSPGGVDPTNVASRRKHMHAFFDYMLPGIEERIHDEMRQASVRSTCDSLNNAKIKAIGTPCFEFLVDQSFWSYRCKFLFAHLVAPSNTVQRLRQNGYPTPHWPWAKYRPKVADMEHGWSVVYHEWLKDKKAAENKAADETGETGETAPQGKAQAGAPKKLGSEVAKVRGPDEHLRSSMWAPHPPEEPKPETGLKPTVVAFHPRPVIQEPYQRPPIPN